MIHNTLQAAMQKAARETDRRIQAALQSQNAATAASKRLLKDINDKLVLIMNVSHKTTSLGPTPRQAEKEKLQEISEAIDEVASINYIDPQRLQQLLTPTNNATSAQSVMSGNQYHNPAGKGYMHKNSSQNNAFPKPEKFA